MSNNENTLKRSLSLFGGTALILNIVIGAGLLVLPGLVYQEVGHVSMASWITCGIVAFPLLIVFIMLGRLYPDAGGITHYAFRAFGNLGQRVAAFIFLGAIIVGLPSIALTGGYYLNTIVNGPPHAYAALFVVFALLLHGVSGGWISKVLGVIGSTVISVLFCLLIIGAFGAWESNSNPVVLLPEEISLSLIWSPFMMIFFAFTGWEIAAHTAEEFKNPKRDFPLAMILAFVIAMILYVAIALVVQKSELTTNFESPFVEITRPVLGDYGVYFVALIAVTLIFANVFGIVWGVSRMIYSLGRDRVLPGFFAVTNDNGTPVYAVWLTVTGVLASIFLDYLGFLGINKMLSLAGQNFLILYGIAAIALYTLSNQPLIRYLSLFVAALIIGIILFAGVQLYYPIGLIAFAAIVNLVQKKTLGNPLDNN